MCHAVSFKKICAMSWTGPCAVATNGDGETNSNFGRCLAPPPVPPRPSKNLIEKALARTRGHPKCISPPAVPTRPAPAPPAPMPKTTLVKVTRDNNTTIFVNKDIQPTGQDNSVIYQQNIHIESQKNSKNDENHSKLSGKDSNKDNTISLSIKDNIINSGDKKYSVFSLYNGELFDNPTFSTKNENISKSDESIETSHSISLQMLREISKVSSGDEDTNVFDGGLLVDKVQEKMPVLTQTVWPTGQHKHGLSTSATTVLPLDTSGRTISVTSLSSEKESLVEALIDELRETSQQRSAQNLPENEKTEPFLYQASTLCQINIEPAPPSNSSSSTSTSVSDFSYCCCDKQKKHPPREMTSLHGLPPLPKSLSGINLFETTSKSAGQPVSVASTSLNPVDEVETPRYRSFQNSKPGSSSKGPPLPPTRTYKNGVQQDQPPPIRPRKTGLDSQLSILRKEMVSTLFFQIYSY